MYKYYTKSERETVALAKKLARGLKGGDVLLLEGELGSGKTTFVRGLAQALGVRERIKSPTFVLMRVHKLAKSLGHRAKSARTKALCSMPYALCYFVHIDAYRVKNARELQEAGLLDWLGRSDTITVIEWGEKIKTLLKGARPIVVKFAYGEKRDERVITLLPRILPLRS